MLWSTVNQEMPTHDVFMCPTLFEGHSLAVAEVLSQGLPVITTSHSGPADIVVDGVRAGSSQSARVNQSLHDGCVC